MPEKNSGGATAIEYGLIAVLIAVVIIGILQALSSPETPTKVQETEQVN